MSALRRVPRHRWLLLAIVVLGAVLRLWLWWRTPVHQPANDEVEYLTVARDLLAGRGWRFYERYHWLRAPLYPLWLACSLWLAGGDLRWAALPNIAVSTGSIGLFYLLGREIGDDDPRAPRAIRAGLITALLAALLLTLATFASLWMAETLFTALFCGALILLLRYRRRPHAALAILAGALLGLAILVRSVPMTTLPFAALWLLWGGRRATGDRPQAADDSWSVVRSSGVAALLFVLATAVTIAPWTIRNVVAYDAFIPVETGLSFNLWAFNEPRESLDTIFRTLEQIPNPGDRSDYATAKGLARLREDPAILLRKLWPNWVYLWRVKPIEDRFLQESYQADVPFDLFATALVLDDALYYAALVLAIGGLLLAPRDRRKWLLAGWLVYAIGVMLLTHTEARYRHFLFPALLPYAAWLLTHRALLRWHGARSIGRLAIAMVLLASLIVPLIDQYPRQWAAMNLRRGWAVVRAEQADRSGVNGAAIDRYRRAAAIDEQSADVFLALGRLYQRRGDDQQALDAFQTAFDRKRLYVATNVALGDALRRLGRLDESRAAFRGFYTDEVQMLEWGWRHLDAPAPPSIAVGDGLDFGFVSGMYAAEESGARRVRWTRETARLRLAGSAAPATIALTISSPRPDGAVVPATICVDMVLCQTVQLDARWQTILLAVPPRAEYEVRLIAPTFSPQQFDPASVDDRALGLLIDHAAVRGNS